MAHRRLKRLTRRAALRAAAAVACGLIIFSAVFVLAFRFVNPPLTSLMALRAVEHWWNNDDVEFEQQWISFESISPHLVRAVIAGEDSGFVRHRGVDWEALWLAYEHNQSGKTLYGGSTITMQTVKNVFLWPSRSYVRKSIEIYLACLSDVLWGKRRLLEIYLNVVEWGDGIYGAEAAAKRYFGKPASNLTMDEAALLAAVLPNPRRWSPARPTKYIEKRRKVILNRMRNVVSVRT